MILGTAGHIDHGKTALVRALTGVDTDRLPEEKARGITIELGFAPLRLDGLTVGVVDVPGHEAFVRTMLTGASGVDIAMLVVGADEGVMAQTSEHAAILDLLGVEHAVVALSKCDLVDQDWLALVKEDVRTLLAPSRFADAPIVPVSAKTGEGIEQLRLVIADIARTVRGRGEDDLFRMPVDRAFTLRGTGTVVTGTVWSGALQRGEAILLPPGRTVRVRDLQSHGSPVPAVTRGMRAAVALAAVAPRDIERGAVLITSRDWEPTRTLRATLTLLGDAPHPGPRTRVRFHLGAADVGARIVRLSDAMVRVHLEADVVCRSGDRFVIRGGAALTTLGGGTVVDPCSRRRARALELRGEDPAALLHALLREAGDDGLKLASLPVRLGSPPSRVQEVLAQMPRAVTSARMYSIESRDAACRRLLAAVDDRHARDRLAPGLTREEAHAATDVSDELFELALADAMARGEIEAQRNWIRRPGWEPRLDEQQESLARQILAALAAAEEPTAEAAAATQFGSDGLPVLRQLEREGKVVRLGETLAAADTVGALVGRLRESMVPGQPYTPSQLRDAMGLSRRVLIPLLEYCDRVRITERRGSERVLRG
jgi:selenocysteine-specific elongation factor